MRAGAAGVLVDGGVRLRLQGEPGNGMRPWAAWAGQWAAAVGCSAAVSGSGCGVVLQPNRAVQRRAMHVASWPGWEYGAEKQVGRSALRGAIGRWGFRHMKCC